MPTRAGDLNRRGTLQTRGSTKDNMGGQVNTWTDAWDVAFAYNSLSVSQRFLAESVRSEINCTLTMRFDPRLADPKAVAAMRLKYVHRGVTRYFDIKGIANTDEGDFEIVMYAAEGLADG